MDAAWHEHGRARHNGTQGIMEEVAGAEMEAEQGGQQTVFWRVCAAAACDEGGCAKGEGSDELVFGVSGDAPEG